MILVVTGILRGGSFQHIIRSNRHQPLHVEWIALQALPEWNPNPNPNQDVVDAQASAVVQVLMTMLD